MKNDKLTHMDRNELIQRTFPYLLKRLEDAGIDATPQVDPKTNGYILTVDTMRFNVENLLSDLSRSDQAQHQEYAQHQDTHINISLPVLISDDIHQLSPFLKTCFPVT